MAYQLRFVLRSYSQDTKETNQELLRRRRLKSAKEQVLKRLDQFVKRQSTSDPSLLPLYLPRAIRLQSALKSLEEQIGDTEPRQDRQITCDECGILLTGTGALRRHKKKTHASVLVLKGPRFTPKEHSLPGTHTCKACLASFKSVFYLRKHVETSTCPKVELLLRVQEEVPPQQTSSRGLQERLQTDVESSPESAATNPEYHSIFMESCVLCGQALPGQKGAKQHLNRQHPEIMSSLESCLQERLKSFKVLLHKGEHCRFCHHKVDAPGRHVQQCVPLLQAHVLQEVSRLGLDMQPRAYEPKTRKQPLEPSDSKQPKPQGNIGLES